MPSVVEWVNYPCGGTIYDGDACYPQLADIAGPLNGKMHATRALTLVFIFCGALKVVYVLLGKVCCGADGGGGFGYLTLVQVLSGWAGWLVYLWILINISDSDASEHEQSASLPA